MVHSLRHVKSGVSARRERSRPPCGVAPAARRSRHGVTAPAASRHAGTTVLSSTPGKEDSTAKSSEGTQPDDARSKQRSAEFREIASAIVRRERAGAPNLGQEIARALEAAFQRGAAAALAGQYG